MWKLLTMAQFRRTRDEIALIDMTERLVKLQSQRDTLRIQYVGLYGTLQMAIKNNDKDVEKSLKYELYDQPDKHAYGSHGGIAWQYAHIDALIGDIQRDKRYQNRK